MIKLPKHKLAIEPIFDRDKTPGGLWIPDQAKERCDQGIVKYIGEDVNSSIKIGSHVIFSGYSGSTVRIDNELLIFIHQDFIKATLDVDNYIVPGLFCKGKIDSFELESELRHIIRGISQTEINLILKVISEQLDSFMIPAPYNTSCNLIQQAHQSFADNGIDVKELKRDEIDERSR